jgi:gliding motility-associated-like protein
LLQHLWELLVNFRNTLRTKSYIFFLLSCLTFYNSYSQDYSNVQFIENRGQWDSRVLFMAEVPAGVIYIHQTGYTVVQHDTKDWEQVYDILHGHTHDGKSINLQSRNINIKSHAFKVNFLNAAAKPQVVPDKALQTRNNYYLGSDPSKWATNCRTYLGVTVKEIYPGVDIRYYSQNGLVKYDLIAKPGADVSKIALKYDGVDKLEIKGKELHIPTTVGTLKELAPYTYQYAEGGKQEVSNKYLIKGNVVRFDLKKYNRNSTLVIDPTLIFCSFSGSRTGNWGFTATYGPDGSMYGGGIVFGEGFPVSPGAFQSKFAGGSGSGASAPYDIGIIKLSPDGVNRIYATYIGGPGKDQPHSLVVDGGGNLVIAGRSDSNKDYPTTNSPGAPGGVFGAGGDWDIVVTKLDANGQMVGSKRIGGTNSDGVNISESRTLSSLQQNYGDDGRSEVILDGDNILVASCTQSVNFPAANGFQGANAGGQNGQDGVFFKLSGDVSTLLYSTYLGGKGNDAAYVLSLSPLTGDIYIGGGTESVDFPGSGNGGVQPGPIGGIDGFVTRLTNGGAMIRTIYVGTSNIDQVYGVQFDKFGFPYIMGQTSGNWAPLNAAWSQPGGQFIAKLEPDLSRYVYRTTFGTNPNMPNISPVAMLVDRCENVYISGWGGTVVPSFRSAGTTGMSITPDAIQASTDGKDFYFFVLKKNASAQLFGSFFGQNGGLTDHVDGGTSRFDARGIIYQAICANCSVNSDPPNRPFPTTPGVWAETNPAANSSAGAGCNLAMVKIEMDFAGVRAAPQSLIDGVPRDTMGCIPLMVDFTDTIQNAISYEWDFGDGSPRVIKTYPDVVTQHTYNNVGIYRVMQIAIDSNTCNIRDTAYITIKVGDNRAEPDFNAVKISGCNETVFRYRFDNSTTPVAGQPFSARSFKWIFGDGSAPLISGPESVNHTYTSAGTYNVSLILIDSIYCNYPDTIQKTLRIATNVEARFQSPQAGCAPFLAQFNNTSLAGQQFYWNFGDGATSTEISPEHLYNIPGTYTITLIAVDSSTCNIADTVTATLIVSDKPAANFTAAPQPPIVNKPIVFTNLSSPDAIRFKWLFGDGDSLVTTSSQPVEHEYNSTDTFNVCLIAYNQYNCTDTICKPIATLIDAAVDVPNAFTPLSSDGNNIVYARGFGITKMRFIIWNRWGQKVFETNTKTRGWDGKYNGVLQPMDVYAYTLDVEFYDGKKVTKTGDITLIR